MTGTPADHPCDKLSVIAIDGPSGAGKSTVAKAVAYQLSWHHLDTGSMYRAVTLFLLRRAVDIDDGDAVESALAELRLRVGESGRVWIDEDEITEDLRRRSVEDAVSRVSAMPVVRRSMRELQRAQARLGPLVAEGRDMTSVVFPDARFKFFVDAQPEERARRRQQDFQRAGRDASLDEVRVDIERRDLLDSTRDEAPLQRVEDAVYLDTTGIGIAEVVAEIVRRVEAESPGDG